MPKTYRRNLLVLRLLVIVLLFGSGCAKPEEENPAIPSLDLGFASPGALLEKYNSITTREPVDIVAAYDLFYAENDFQRQYIAVSRRMKPFAELDRVMFEQFGECYDPKRKKHLLSPDQAATLIQENEQRAEARFVDREGASQTLHMVKIGDHWWVSGFTFEHDPELIDIKQEMASLERLNDALVVAAPMVIDGIRSGKINSASEARDSLNSAVRNQVSK